MLLLQLRANLRRGELLILSFRTEREIPLPPRRDFSAHKPRLEMTDGSAQRGA
jgi:hypothetical protein